MHRTLAPLVRWGAAVLAATAGGCAGADEEQLALHLSQAQAYMEKQRYPAALHQVERALELDPEAPKARAMEGWCLLFMGYWGPVDDPHRNAFDTFHRAIEELGDDANLWFGVASVHLKRLIRAEEDAVALAEIDRLLGPLRAALAAPEPGRGASGFGLQAAGREGAAAALARLQELVAHFARDRAPPLFVTDPALRELTEMPAGAAAAPGRGASGFGLQAAGREGEEPAPRVRRADPDRRWWVYVEAPVLRALYSARWEPAAQEALRGTLAAFELALAQAETAARRRWLAQFQLGEADRIRAACDAIARANPEHLQAAHLRGTLAVRLQIIEPYRSDAARRRTLRQEGIAAFEQYLALEAPYHQRARARRDLLTQEAFAVHNPNARSVLLQEHGLIEDSLEVLERKRVDVLMELAALCEQTDDEARAQAAYAEVLRLRPDDPMVFLRRGGLAARGHDYARALELFAQARRLASETSKTWEAADAQFRATLAKHRADLRCLDVQGAARARRGDRETALAPQVRVPAGARVHTALGAQARLQAAGCAVLTLGPATALEITELRAEPREDRTRLTVLLEGGSARLTLGPHEWALATGAPVTLALSFLADDWFQAELDLDGDGRTDESVRNEAGDQ